MRAESYNKPILMGALAGSRTGSRQGDASWKLIIWDAVRLSREAQTVGSEETSLEILRV